MFLFLATDKSSTPIDEDEKITKTVILMIESGNHLTRPGYLQVLGLMRKLKLRSVHGRLLMPSGLNVLQYAIKKNDIQLLEMIFVIGLWDSMFNERVVMKNGTSFDIEHFAILYGCPRTQDALKRFNTYEKSMTELAKDCRAGKTLHNVQISLLKCKDKAKFGVIEWAVIGGNTETFNKLVALGTDVVGFTKQLCHSLLHLAVVVGNSQLIEPILKVWEDVGRSDLVFSQNKCGETALDITVANGDAACIKELALLRI